MAASILLLWMVVLGDIPSAPSFRVPACGPANPAGAAWLRYVDSQAAEVREDTARLQAQIAALGSPTHPLDQGAGAGSSSGDLVPMHPSFRSIIRLPEPFLFVGVLSTGGSRSRRDAVRATWMTAAPASVLIRFMLYEEERSTTTLAEAGRFGDMVFVPSKGKTDYRSIVVKVWAMVEWVVSNLNPNFILKTDDDAYVDCAALVADLRGRCKHSDCRNERLYLGEEKRNGEVITKSGDKWSNEEYWRHTGLKEYFPYMFGGGYVFSSDIARALHLVNQLTALKTMPNEDATFGFWVSGLNLVRVSHPLVHASAGGCCLQTLGPNPEQGPSPGLWGLRAWEPMCAGWLVLHKVDSAAMMHYLHGRLAACSGEQTLMQAAGRLAPAPTAPWLLPPLQAYLVSGTAKGYHWLAEQPWAADGGALLLYQVAAAPALTPTGAPLVIGVTDLTAGTSTSLMHSSFPFEQLDNSTAWSWRGGARAHWVSPTTLAFNDWACGVQAPCTVLLDVPSKTRVGTLPRPIFAASSDGRKALSLCLARLESAAPGHGVHGMGGGAPAGVPADDGLWQLPLKLGAGARLLVSYQSLLAAVAAAEPPPKAAAPAPVPAPGDPGAARPWEPLLADAASQCHHALHQATYSPDGTRVAFQYLVTSCSNGARDAAYTFTINEDGTGLWMVPGLPLTPARGLSLGPEDSLAICVGRAVHVARARHVTRLSLPPELAKWPGSLVSCTWAPDRSDVLAVELRSAVPSNTHLLAVWDLVTNRALLGLVADLAPAWSPDGHALAYSTPALWEQGMQALVVGVTPAQTWRRGGAAAGAAAGDAGGGGRAARSARPGPSAGPEAAAALRPARPAPGASRVLLDVTGGSLVGLAHLAPDTLSTWTLHAIALPAMGTSGAAGGAGAPSPAAPPHLHVHTWRPGGNGSGGAEGSSLGVPWGLDWPGTMPDITHALLGSQGGSSLAARGRRGVGSLWRELRSWLDPGDLAGAPPWTPSWGPDGGDPGPADAAAARFVSATLATVAAGGQGDARPRSVVLALALHNPLQYHILRQLVLDGNILLVERLLVRWPVSVRTWHQAQLYEGLLGVLHIPWETLG